MLNRDAPTTVTFIDSSNNKITTNGTNLAQAIMSMLEYMWKTDDVATKVNLQNQTVTALSNECNDTIVSFTITQKET